MKIQTLITVLVLAASGATWAQAPASTTATPGVDKRIENQQKRIDQGVASGQLTGKEAVRMQKREDHLKSDVAAAKADGTVTPQERKKLQHEANRNSEAIYKNKHNGKTVK